MFELFLLGRVCVCVNLIDCASENLASGVVGFHKLQSWVES